MGIPAKKLVQLLIENDPASPEFRQGVRSSLQPELIRPSAVPGDDLGIWRDVFVERKLPWSRFALSTTLHVLAFGLIWVLSLVWLRQQRIIKPEAFDRSSLITYSPEEYLPPLDTGAAEAPKPERGDPAFAKQPILSVPREADNRTQTIVAPPDIKLNHDVALPNIVAMGTVAPVVPLDATRALTNRAIAPDQQVVAPTPELEMARDRVTQAAMKTDIVPPPAEVSRDRTRSMNGPDASVIEPPPELSTAAKGHVGQINIGPSQVVAPAPQLAMSEQHTARGRGKGGAADALLGSAQPVAPAPTVGGGGNSQGRLIALGIHPVAPTGPIQVPAGNRRGTFSAGPNGKPGAAGTPDFGSGNVGGNGSNGTANSGSGLRGRKSNLPEGLRVGAASGPTGPIERNGAPGGDGTGDGREVASLSPSNRIGGAAAGQRVATPVSNDKVTDVDRQVFGDRRAYAMTVNMPNLNSSTGSWVIRFAELKEQKQGELLAPVPTEKSDPGYPLELIRANVHGSVTLSAVIHSDGRVGDVHVLNSPDDRLDPYASRALTQWKFLPAMKDGKPVPLQAVIVIPFRVAKVF